MIKIIHSAKKAIKDFNQKVTDFQEIQNRMERQNLRKMVGTEQQPATETLDGFMMQKGIPVAFSTKSHLARKMGMGNYIGSKEQDDLLMVSMKGQHESEAVSKQAEAEGQYKEKEFGLKEKELELKKQQMEANKAPSADEIADSIIKKYKNQ